MSARTIALALGILLLPLPALAFPPGADGVALRQAAEALAELRVEDAARLLEPVHRRHPRDADVLYERALILFHQGDYAGAADAIERAVDAGPNAPDLQDRRALGDVFRATRDATRGFVEARSADGRYVVRHEPGPDAVLVPYALEALATADRAMQSELGIRHPGPIRVEIYPSPRSLARVSTLTVEEIERTGTIALCKWDRLMITSPRALVRGYPWLDTIAHEHVHLMLSRASRDRAPVWFQEGMAKFLERRWRGEPAAAHLEPASAALLDRAVRADGLLPFDRLHPSIARLPSQEDAALAFAQVATFIEAFHARHGAAGLRDAVTRIAAGTDAREALAAVSGTSFARLETSWREGLRARPRQGNDAPRVVELRFRHGAGEADETTEVQVERARRYLRLGDLLWGRTRPGAAAVEYARAHGAAPDDPIVASRLARASLASGRPARAIAALERIEARYPEHAPVHVYLGAARVRTGDLVRARVSLHEALRLNPFDPQPHCDLAVAAEGEAERARESAACRSLGGTPTDVREMASPSGAD
jgi:Flp pilus assembly protein TadD